MLVQSELIKKIKDFGLNSYEAKIWTALLSRGVSSAGELSDISNVPRSRTYDVLESLEKKGFIIMKLGKPIKYMAIPPTEVINVIKKKIKEESDKQENLMEELKTSQILQELSSLHTHGIDTVEPSDLVGLLKNRSNVYDYMESMMKNAEKTVCIVTSHEGLQRKIENMKKTFKKVAEKGVHIKILVPQHKDTDKLAQELKGFAEVKTIQALQARFVLVDDKHLVFMITNDKDVHPSYDVGVWINTPYFSSALKEMFEMMWKKK
jgi:HTH-type transcriptional regulator, sugar sensing transcriptional regulator